MPILLHLNPILMVSLLNSYPELGSSLDFGKPFCLLGQIWACSPVGLVRPAPLCFSSTRPSGILSDNRWCQGGGVWSWFRAVACATKRELEVSTFPTLVKFLWQHRPFRPRAVPIRFVCSTLRTRGSSSSNSLGLHHPNMHM